MTTKKIIGVCFTIIVLSSISIIFGNSTLYGNILYNQDQNNITPVSYTNIVSYPEIVKVNDSWIFEENSNYDSVSKNESLKVSKMPDEYSSLKQKGYNLNLAYWYEHKSKDIRIEFSPYGGLPDKNQVAAILDLLELNMEKYQPFSIFRIVDIRREEDWAYVSFLILENPKDGESALAHDATAMITKKLPNNTWIAGLIRDKSGDDLIKNSPDSFLSKDAKLLLVSDNL